MPGQRRTLPRPWLVWAIAGAGVGGFALIWVAFRLAEHNHGFTAGHWLFWAGLAAIVAPAAARLSATGATRHERVLLALYATALCYAVKVLYEPSVFGFPDEFTHLANARNIVALGHLYAPNTVLPASPGFPGLAACAAVLSEVSGLGLFASGVLIIGLARLVETAALFLLLERLLGSDRLAGVGVVIYAANANWFFWTSQFAYESLSLPLLVVALLCVVLRDDARSAGADRAWTGVSVLLIAAITVTHHLTSYALVAVLWLLVVLHVAGVRARRRPPLDLALFATVVAVGWLFTVAETTKGYLGSIFLRASESVTDTLRREGAIRTPFKGVYASGPPTPINDRLISLAGLLCVAALVIVGLLKARRLSFAHPLALLLTLAAPALLCTYALRLFPGAWETANRTSEFLFIGVALVGSRAALAFVDRPRGRPALRRGLLAAGAVLIVASGIVIGWPANARLPRPLEVRVDGGTIPSQTVAVADWAADWVPSNLTIVADEPAGRRMLVDGRRVYAGGSPGVPQLLSDPAFPAWEKQVIIDKRVSYVVLDARRSSVDNVTGAGFRRPAAVDGAERLYPPGVRGKYAALPEARLVYSSQDIAVFDVSALWRGRTAPG